MLIDLTLMYVKFI
uniref:Uncharacterized protein n=1 Tax=Streptomyces clavuligerus TaxID=1901 RepID=Q6TMP8_STRCL|nr:hypothetical protein pSCL2.6.207.7 [Streptomyces clavuligerus]